jgi:sugar phosphate isomerase/epimerase
MILYGTGDPITALDTLAPYVITVHCKDGDWPSSAIPGALGAEQPLGQGSVGMERFIAKLKEIGYKGPLIIEREASDPEQRRGDILMAVELLRRLGGRASAGAGL